MPEPPHAMLVYTDNANTVAMFDSLRAKPVYNPILMSTVNILLHFDVDLRVAHVPGNHNIIADALSRYHNELIVDLVPSAQIFTFEPPRDALGVPQK